MSRDRSSIDRRMREVSETTTIARMKAAEMAMPSGFSMTFWIRVVAETTMTNANPSMAARSCRRRAER
jgi:hypothetical protein